MIVYEISNKNLFLFFIMDEFNICASHSYKRFVESDSESNGEEKSAVLRARKPRSTDRKRLKTSHEINTISSDTGSDVDIVDMESFIDTSASKVGTENLAETHLELS